jgi:hypothetical protein
MPHKRDGPASVGTTGPEAIGKNHPALLPLFDCQSKQAPQNPVSPRVELQQTPSPDPITIVVDGAAVAKGRARPQFTVTFRPLAGVDGIKALRRTLKFALRACRLEALDA